MIQDIKNFFAKLFGPVPRALPDTTFSYQPAAPLSPPPTPLSPSAMPTTMPTQTPTTVPAKAKIVAVPAVPPANLLQKFCLAIQAFEGYLSPTKTNPQGSTSYRFNNPGNLVYAGQPYATPAVVEMPTGKHTFAHFDTYEHGFQALENQVRVVGLGESAEFKAQAMSKYGLPSSAMLTIIQFFGIYSPSSDGNDPNHYGETVAADCGVPSSTTMKEVVA
jgi:hypothetical protein